MKRHADWLAWFLQFILGLAVGAVLGLALTSRGRRSAGRWMDPEQVPILVWGAALVGASLASWYGDRLWLGGSYRIIPPDEMGHSRTSRIVSIAAGTLGLILMGVALVRHFGAV